MTARSQAKSAWSRGSVKRTAESAGKSYVNSDKNNGRRSGTGLRPFFGFYGGKWRDTLRLYPRPEHEVVIEPFAGSAGYSLRYADRKVILCEVDPVLAGVWSYLIRVRPSEVLSLPDISEDQSLDDLKVCEEAKWLIGFWLNRATTGPRKSPSKWMREGIRPGSFWGDRVRQTIASQVDAIRHWKVTSGDYTRCATRRKATWFIDPPYQRAGTHYRYGSQQIDYAVLRDWCISRNGQVIVCENKGATWLPFKDLADVKTTRRQRRSKEVVWVNGSHERDV